MYKFFFKRFFDVFISLVALIMISPFFLILFIAIKADSKGPIFFRQKRVGKHKKLFFIHKFRTMKTDTPRDMPTHLLENPELYITRVGKFLRKTSLDELPQIWDIFVGKMSIIGPRPALWNQDDLISERDTYIDKKGRSVNDLRPGLSGWAQIHGRDELEIDVKAALDGYYLRHIGLIMDIKCFFGTIFSVVRSEGVVEGGTGRINNNDVSQQIVIDEPAVPEEFPTNDESEEMSVQYEIAENESIDELTKDESEDRLAADEDNIE